MKLDTKALSAIRRSYEKNGYYVARGLFTPGAIRVLEREFDRIVAQLQRGNEETNARWRGPEMERLGAANTEVLHTHNVQHYSAAWLRAIQRREFLKIVEALIGPDIVLHHTKLFQKPAEKGAPFSMHQDWTYFPTEKDSMMAAIIHVSAATDAMGCFRVYPGSHKLGRVPATSGQEENECLAKYPIDGATPLTAKPGDVVFFHYFLIHGSNPNRSTHVRKTVLVQMHAGDDAVEAGVPHPNEHLVLNGWNHRATRTKANAAKG